jgi:hypothetical protein
MRRLATLLILPVLATAGCQLASAGSSPIPGPTPSIPGDVEVEAATGAGQGAVAIWIFVRRNSGTLYIAQAYRAGEVETYDEPPAGVEAAAFVARGTCEVRRRPHGGRSVSCHGRGWGREIAPTDFEADPTLSSARVAFRAAGHRQVVRWTGREEGPEPDVGAFLGPGFAFAGAGASRDALAAGRLFGKRIRGGVGRHGVRFAYLGEGAGGFAFGYAEIGPFPFEQRFSLPG